MAMFRTKQDGFLLGAHDVRALNEFGRTPELRTRPGRRDFSDHSAARPGASTVAGFAGALLPGLAPAVSLPLPPPLGSGTAD